MKPNLPAVIQTYIDPSNGSDLTRVINCFSENACVLDEGEERIGHKEIKSWFKKTRSKYQFKSEPLKMTNSNDDFTLKTKVSGTFPGSPVTLNYHFVIRDDLIQRLQIELAKPIGE